ncbi:MAG: alpha-glucosidase [Myxococcaceae bacterium]|nr:alpha-glucosidase [Myxococcaceae bacterium]
MQATDDIPWWKRTTVYQIYPRSFADSNGDGIGDLQGVIGKLDYLQSLGVETLWLSPFYDSPQADFGYDIRDYFSVAPEYGTLEDARLLIDEVHARSMKIVFDMVLNHTSDQHPWFVASRSSRTDPKRDWYIWRDGRGAQGDKPPNNWRSMLGNNGWHRDAASGQWYWASFLPFQPDLNYRNPEVKETMLEVVRHWLRQGVDGLRLDIFNAIYKDESFADNPFALRFFPTAENPHGFFQRSVHTIDHPDTLRFARDLRTAVDAFADPPRFLVGEVFGDPTTLRDYCGSEADGLHLVFLFKTLRMRSLGRHVRALIEEIERAFPEPYTPTWVFGNHDRVRLLSRLRGHEPKAKLFATLQLTVRGVPFIYYGEEIGMEHAEVPLVRGLDPVAMRHRKIPQWLARRLARAGMLLNRDESRAPMQWHGGEHAGFSEGAIQPWLALHPRADTIHVDAQEAAPESLLHCYRALLALRRQSPALNAGRLELAEDLGLPRDVVAYRRRWAESEPVWVVLNFSARAQRLTLPTATGMQRFSNLRCETAPFSGQYDLAPYEGVVLYDPASVTREPARTLQ